MTLTRNAVPKLQAGPPPEPDRCTDEEADEPRTEPAQTPEQAVLADYLASLDGPGRPLSQRFLAEKHGINRRKVKQIIVCATEPDPNKINNALS